ncbi:gamma-aminobutyric acid receptor subunit alpha-4 isoform X5 [Dipodomys spectabilis]|uniref:gamma-aminobutyric acid receptor subunit alpha-4 isoform X5 n=1 Tax=Dipodomys spectabilis TaxID=105255 RepID=UPI001C53A5CF|nr:gamma-aminobutyric acid receptor subunit alpha-4 isoform X5 [Dipodomys spectabilis]
MVSAKKVPAIALCSGFSVALLHFLCLAVCLNESPGENQKEEKMCPENFTRILDSLLDGYDNRLRPGFGEHRCQFEHEEKNQCTGALGICCQPQD